ncbi:hypothetical protein [Streptomyces sp. NPDC015125]|uniref:hypothetical protein n=1 Tax=Streptomyces sp. NPDC015125 TaxID=3364938 RepID=UPI003700E34D
MAIFKRRKQPDGPGSSDSPEPDLHKRVLPELTQRAADNPRLKELLAEVERGRQRRAGQATEPEGRSDMGRRVDRHPTEPSDGIESAPLHAHEIGPDDAHLIRMLANSHFEDSAQVELPNGKAISGAEMRRWIEAQDT